MEIWDFCIFFFFNILNKLLIFIFFRICGSLGLCHQQDRGQVLLAGMRQPIPWEQPGQDLVLLAALTDMLNKALPARLTIGDHLRLALSWKLCFTPHKLLRNTCIVCCRHPTNESWGLFCFMGLFFVLCWLGRIRERPVLASAVLVEEPIWTHCYNKMEKL